LLETLKKMYTSLSEYLAKLSRKTKIQLGILSLVVITLAIVATVLLTRTNWVVLPGTGDADATATIHATLVDMGIPVRVEGISLLVPEPRLGEIEMRLREQGVMGMHGLDWDMLQLASGFGITENHARQLSEAQRGEHVRTQLMQLERIHNAIVIVNFGETSPFRLQTNLRRPTVSVMLTIVDGGVLSHTESNAIGELIRGGIPGVELEDISLVDTAGNWYQLGVEPTEPIDIEFIMRMHLESTLTTQFQTQVLQLLSPSFGMSNIRVQPHVRLNFDRIVTEQVEFAPPVPGELGGIVRSSEIIHERSRRWGGAEGIPGTDSNAMGSIEYPWGTFDDQDLWMRNVETLNYEINETRRMIEHEMGVISYASIAVNINRNIEGIEEDEDFTAEVAELASMAIGVPLSNVSVQFLPFVEDPQVVAMREAREAAEAAQRTRELVEMIIMYAVIVLLGVMVFLLGRTIVKALSPEPEPEPILATAGSMEGIDYMIADEVETAVEYEDVDLTAKSPGLEQVERFIDKDAATVAQLLRNWLSDEA